jgi:hypothetical protein
MSSLTLDNGSLLYNGRYDPGLVAALKQQIPSSDRAWDGARKAWRVTPAHADTLVALTQQYLGETIQAPQITHVTPTSRTDAFEIRYIGATKDRGGEYTAFGWVNGAWSVIFPESVLRTWFEQPARPDEERTLYAVLSVKPDTGSADLKTAYRRLARQWHPDVCREPGATQVFQTIQHAYAILSDDTKRARYDAGLALAATLRRAEFGQQTLDQRDIGYRSPLRCGLILAEGTPSLSRFIVSAILAWEDITDDYGRTLSTSWPVGADRFVESWL